MTLIRPIKFGDDKSKAPASFLFLAGAWLFLSLFISIQLLPPASRIRLAAIVGAMAGMMVTDTVFLEQFRPAHSAVPSRSRYCAARVSKRFLNISVENAVRLRLVIFMFMRTPQT